MQESNPECSRVAQHALVLGSSGYVRPNPIVPAQSADSILQSDSTQESVKPKIPCLAPRSSLRQWQYKLRSLKEAQPDQSMRQSG